MARFYKSVLALVFILLFLNSYGQEDYSGQYLGGRDFSGANLKGTLFKNSDLRNVIFSNADLTGADLSDSKLWGAQFSGATLTNVKWSRALFSRFTTWPQGFDPAGKDMFGPSLDYSGRVLTGNTIVYSDFFKANFTNAIFNDMDLRGVNFESANLTNASLKNTFLPGANFSQANLTNVDWTKASFSRSTIWPDGFITEGKGMFGPNLNFSGQDFRGNVISYYDLSGSNLSSTIMSGMDLRGTIFESANLRSADLSGTYLPRTNFLNADLTNVDFTGAIYHGDTEWPFGFNPACGGMYGPKLDYSGQDFSGKSFGYYDLRDALFISAKMTDMWMVSNFDDANLTNADLRGSKLINCVFENAILMGADLSTSTITNSNFKGAKYNAGTKWPLDFNPVSAGAILVNTPNNAPTDILLQTKSITNGMESETFIAELSGVDPEGGFLKFYLSGCGGDNSFFKINGDSLVNIKPINLSEKSNYTIFIKVTDEGGLSFSKQFNISLETDGVTDVDGNRYKTIRIGNQVWMQENLKVTRFSNGDPISYRPESNLWGSSEKTAWAFLKNNPENDALYGKLYNWYAAADPRGVCPTGWRLPNESDWKILAESLGGEALAGGAMKNLQGWPLPNQGATNSSGWTGLPGGARFASGEYGGLDQGYWWSNSEYFIGEPILTNANYYSLGSTTSNLSSGNIPKSTGFSIRCVQDGLPSNFKAFTKDLSKYTRIAHLSSTGGMFDGSGKLSADFSFGSFVENPVATSPDFYRKFVATPNTRILFVSGDREYWGIANFQSIQSLVSAQKGDLSPNITFQTFRDGKYREEKGNVLSRPNLGEDPMITISGGHVDSYKNKTLVWAESNISGPFTSLKNNHGGIDVFVADGDSIYSRDLYLSSEVVSEAQPAGTIVGQFFTNEDDSALIAFALVTGDGDADNSLFRLDGPLLKTASILKFSEKAFLSIRVRSVSGNGSVFEKRFTLRVKSSAEIFQPTDLSFSPILKTGFRGTFLPPRVVPDGYLVIRKAAAPTAAIPLDGTTYQVGGTLGDALVISSSSSTIFDQIDLTEGEAYYYSIFSFNITSSGIVYKTTNPLVGSIRTSKNQGPDRPFITVWKTDLPGKSAANELIFEGQGDSYLIEWESVSDPSINGSLSANSNQKISFPAPGTYRLKVSSSLRLFRTGDCFSSLYDNVNDNQKLIRVEQWGSGKWISAENMFCGRINNQVTATDAPDLTTATSAVAMFRDNIKFNAFLNDWNVSSITAFDAMFVNTAINSPLDKWNVSNAISMSAMFWLARDFNQDISLWNVSKVKNMSTMFAIAGNFNQNLNSWDVSSVESMGFMFYQTFYNQPLSNWNVGRVTDMSHMFGGAVKFNQDLSMWNVENVTNMHVMFAGAGEFNSDISNWNTEKVTDMGYMFQNAPKFNQPIQKWNTQNVVTMEKMLDNAASFNQDLGQWKLYKATKLGLSGSGINPVNYSRSLAGWAKDLSNAQNLVLEATGLSYCEIVSRNNLINNFKWQISGDQISESCTGYISLLISNKEKITYGDNSISFTVYTPDNSQINVTSSDPGVIQISGSQLLIKGAGTAVITATVAGTNTTVSETLMVAKASLDVVADNKAKGYGDDNPPLTISYTGFRNGENELVLDTKPALSTTATKTSLPGLYPITLTGGVDNNYALTLQNGTLTVTKLSQTISFTLPATLYQDQSPYTLTATSTSGGPIIYSVTEGPATASGNQLTITGSGTLTVKASQAGTELYSAADATVTTTVGNSFVVSGLITKPTNIPLGSGLAKLFYENGGLAKNGTVTNGNYSITLVRPGRYILQVVPQGNDDKEVFPAYYKSVQLNKDATVIVVAGNTEVSMELPAKPKTEAKGPGEIKGKVVSGNAGGGRFIVGRIAEGSGLPDVPVYLLETGTDKVLRTVNTDKDGLFTFAELPTGSYRIGLDVVGASLANTVTSVSITAEAPVLQVSAAVSSQGGQPIVVLEVDVVTSLKEELLMVRVYPNPGQGDLMIQYQRNSEEMIVFELSDLNGRSLKYVTMLPNSSGTYSLPVGELNLSGGMYLLQVRQAGTGTTVKVVRK